MVEFKHFDNTRDHICPYLMWFLIQQHGVFLLLFSKKLKKFAGKMRNAHTPPSNKHRFNIRDACQDFIVFLGTVHCWNLSALCYVMQVICLLRTFNSDYSIISIFVIQTHKQVLAVFVTSAFDLWTCTHLGLFRQLSRSNLLNNLTHKKLVQAAVIKCSLLRQSNNLVHL